MAKSKKTAKKKATRQRKVQPSEERSLVSWCERGGVLCLNQTDAAKWLGVSVTMFRRYDIKPLESVGRSVFYSAESLNRHLRRAAYEKGFREGQAAVPKDAQDVLTRQAMAELRLTEERADTQALRNAQLRRELAPADVLALALGKLASQVAAIIDALPGRIRRRFPGLSNADIEAIRTECVKAKNACAEIELDFSEDEFDDA